MLTNTNYLLYQSFSDRIVPSKNISTNICFPKAETILDRQAVCLHCGSKETPPFYNPYPRILI